MKKLVLTSIAALFLATGTAHAQNTQFGPWQIVTGSGDGIAWKLNTQTGESYYCYRLSCFPSRQATPQEVQTVLQQQQQQQQQRATQPQR
jgi:hypothetical protein